MSTAAGTAKTKLVIISHRQDAHIPYVQAHLHTDALAVDPLVDSLQGRLEYAWQDGRLAVLFDGDDITNAAAVWYRKPTPLSAVKIDVPERLQQYAASALQEHAAAFLPALASDRWLSEPTAITRAHSKPLQMRVAHQCGFRLPDTLFATSAKRADKFVQHHGVCIAKPQSREIPKDSYVYAKTIEWSDQLNFAGLSHDPYIFQQLIEPVVEYRVTVVGRRAFAAAIDAGPNNGGYRDWRYAVSRGLATITPATLPRRLQGNCIRLVRQLGLAYGAVDLIEDKQGRVWFLEVNPNGQWAFIEHMAGLPIGQAIAGWLEGLPGC